MNDQIIIKFKYSDLPNPCKKDLLILGEKIPPMMQKLFIDDLNDINIKEIFDDENG